MKYKILATGVAAGFTFAFALALSTSLSTTTLRGVVIENTVVKVPWLTLDDRTVGSGATVPMLTNTFFSIPVSVETIDRETLLGHRGPRIRYWGYCFEDESDPLNPPQTVGFPGKLFLSERERQVRQQRDQRLRIGSPLKPPPNPKTQLAENVIRHELDTFLGGMTCYVMSEQPLAIGIDNDNDGLNTQEEKAALTNPAEGDTDGDGIDDGKEVLMLGTDPIRRDTDGDGLIDGLEERNHNGRLDFGETDPRQRDSDGDGLCDGFCREAKVRRICKDNKGSDCLDVPYGQWMGEDKNLNGKVDTEESDPTLPFTVKGDIRDDLRYFRCLLERKKDC